MNTIQAGNRQPGEEKAENLKTGTLNAESVKGSEKRQVKRRGSFEALDAASGEEGFHLGDGNVIEGGEAFGLWQALADEDGVEAFEVGEDDELLQRGVIPDIALGGWMRIAPLFGGLAEEGDVEQIRLAGIDRASLCDWVSAWQRLGRSRLMRFSFPPA